MVVIPLSFPKHNGICGAGARLLVVFLFNVVHSSYQGDNAHVSTLHLETWRTILQSYNLGNGLFEGLPQKHSRTMRAAGRPLITGSLQVA
jgi:hypothetical protein